MDIIRTFASFLIPSLVLCSAACSVSVPDVAEEQETPTKKKPPKGGGDATATEAKASGQSASRATSHLPLADPLEADPDDVACDDESEGLGFCSDEDTIVFCAENQWYELDCPLLEEGAFCAEIIDTTELDCFVEDENGDYVEADEDDEN